MFGSQLSPDRLVLDQQLGIGEHTQPPETLTVRVDSTSSRHALLFFPFDAGSSFESIQECDPYSGTTVCFIPKPNIPNELAAGVIHPGGQGEYAVGFLLNAVNDPPQGIRSVYMREHGECEAAVPWAELLGAVLSEIKGKSGCSDTWLGCFDYSTSFSQRIATSYLRPQGSNVASINLGRGGFGVYIEGRTQFDSLFVCNISFKGKAGYDAVLSADGLPMFQLSSGPQAGTFDCSLSSFCDCPDSDVRNGVSDNLKNKLRNKLNETIEDCLAAPASEFGAVAFPPTCETAHDCASGATAVILGDQAAAEAEARGADQPRRAAFHAALTEEDNWTCAKVEPKCAPLTGAGATEQSVCQLKLRARDIVPMPDSLSLVWYQGGLGGQPPTAAEALYLALTHLDQQDALARLCSEPPVLLFPPATQRAFARVTK